MVIGFSYLEPVLPGEGHTSDFLSVIVQDVVVLAKLKPCCGEIAMYLLNLSLIRCVPMSNHSFCKPIMEKEGRSWRRGDIVVPNEDVCRKNQARVGTKPSETDSIKSKISSKTSREKKDSTKRHHH